MWLEYGSMRTDGKRIADRWVAAGAWETRWTITAVGTVMVYYMHQTPKHLSKCHKGNGYGAARMGEDKNLGSLSEDTLPPTQNHGQRCGVILPGYDDDREHGQ